MSITPRYKLWIAFLVFFSPSITCLLARYFLSPGPFSLYVNVKPIPEPQLFAVLSPVAAGFISLLVGAAVCIAAANYLPRLRGNLARLSPIAWFPILLFINASIALGCCTAIDDLIMRNRKWAERHKMPNVEPDAAP